MHTERATPKRVDNNGYLPLLVVAADGGSIRMNSPRRFLAKRLCRGRDRPGGLRRS